MGALSPDEVAGQRMYPTWAALPPVRARDAALRRFLHEELPPGTRFDLAGFNAAFALCAEFNDDIWPHYVPTCWELVLADRAGHLDSTIKEICEQFAAGR